MIALAALGAADTLLIALRQAGVIRRLPEIPGRLFRSNDVVTSPAAFALGVPDGPVGAAAFALIAALTSRLGAGPPRRRPVATLALLGVNGGVVLAGAHYLRQMLSVQKKLCAYCLVASGLGFTLLSLVASEVAALEREG